MAQIYNIDESFDYSLFDNASCAFGVFDGVHRGHQALFAKLRALAAAHQPAAQSALLTFDPHPLTILRPDRELK